MNSGLINPWILSKLHPNNNYYNHRLFCLSVARKHTHSNLYLFDNFDEQPLLPIFKSRSECERFNSTILNHYIINQNTWKHFQENELSLERCEYVSMHHTLIPNDNNNVDNTTNTRLIPFDLSNSDVIMDLALQTFMTFFIIDQFEFNHSDLVLSLHGIVIEPSFDLVPNDSHVKHMCSVFDKIWTNNNGLL